MTHDQFVTFWTAMLWNVLKLQYRRAKATVAEYLRRYGDRYYRIGRHSTRAQGLLHGRRASDLVWALRSERPLFIRMHADTETLVML